MLIFVPEIAKSAQEMAIFFNRNPRIIPKTDENAQFIVNQKIIQLTMKKWATKMRTHIPANITHKKEAAQPDSLCNNLKYSVLVVS